MMVWGIECEMESESMQEIWMIDGFDDYQAAHKSQSHVARGVHGIGLSSGLDLWEGENVSRSLDLHGHDHCDLHGQNHCLPVLHVRGLIALGVSHCRVLVREFGLVLFVVEQLLRPFRLPAVLCQTLPISMRSFRIPFLE
jgi:hypothetical protein